MIHRVRVPLAALALVALLAGCADMPSSASYRLDTVALQQLKTSDPDEIRRRFGDLDAVVGDTLYGSTSKGDYLEEYRWEIPGALMKDEGMDCNRETGKCSSWHLFVAYDPRQHRLAYVSQSGGELVAHSIVHADGALDFRRGGKVTDPYFRFDYDKTEAVLPNLRVAPIGRAEYVQLRHALQQADAEVRGQERAQARRESEETWRNINLAIQAFGQAAQEVVYEQQQRDHQASVRAAGLAEQVRAQMQQRREEAARQAEQIRLQAAQRAQQPTMPNIKPLPGSRRVAIAPPVARRRPVSPPPARPVAARPLHPVPVPAPVARPVQHVAIATPAAPLPSPEPGPKGKKPELVAYPEAVVVCTVPDAQGRFSCDNPLSTRHGGGPRASSPEDRTPAAKVASMRETCAGAHRLRSSTHMVWGCGFAATGAEAYLDRAGPGVDVQGRQTYYCPPKYPFRCTKTTP